MDNPRFPIPEAPVVPDSLLTINEAGLAIMGLVPLDRPVGSFQLWSLPDVAVTEGQVYLYMEPEGSNGQPLA